MLRRRRPFHLKQCAVQIQERLVAAIISVTILPCSLKSRLDGSNRLAHDLRGAV
jgi:hypothetical protein